MHIMTTDVSSLSILHVESSHSVVLQIRDGQEALINISLHAERGKLYELYADLTATVARLRNIMESLEPIE